MPLFRTHQYSRLKFTDLVSVDGVQFWDMLVPPTIEPQPDDTIHIVQAGERIDQIATAVYQDPALWWVLALANDLDILPTDLTVGMRLKVPAQRYVLGVLIPSSKGRR